MATNTGLEGPPSTEQGVVEGDGAGGIVEGSDSTDWSGLATQNTGIQ